MVFAGALFTRWQYLQLFGEFNCIMTKVLFFFFFKSGNHLTYTVLERGLFLISFTGSWEAGSGGELLLGEVANISGEHCG